MTQFTELILDAAETWQRMLRATTTACDQSEVSQAWAKAEFAPGSASVEEKGEADVLAEEEDVAIGEATAAFRREDLTWSAPGATRRPLRVGEKVGRCRAWRAPCICACPIRMPVIDCV